MISSPIFSSFLWWALLWGEEEDFTWGLTRSFIWANCSYLQDWWFEAWDFCFFVWFCWAVGKFCFWVRWPFYFLSVVLDFPVPDDQFFCCSFADKNQFLIRVFSHIFLISLKDTTLFICIPPMLSPKHC